MQETRKNGCSVTVPVEKCKPKIDSDDLLQHLWVLRAQTYAHVPPTLHRPPCTEPYVYRINEEEVDGTGLLAISPQTQTIAKNMVFNVYFHGTFTHTLPDYLSHSAFKNVLGWLSGSAASIWYNLATVSWC